MSAQLTVYKKGNLLVKTGIYPLYACILAAVLLVIGGLNTLFVCTYRGTR